MSQPCPCDCHPDANPCGKCLNWHKENDADFQKQFGIGVRGIIEPTQARSAASTDASGNSAHVEPSGDDTLTEILLAFMPAESESGGDITLAEAHTQLLQYIEGEKAKLLEAEYAMLWEFWIDPLNDDVEVEELLKTKLTELKGEL